MLRGSWAKLAGALSLALTYGACGEDGTENASVDAGATRHDGGHLDAGHLDAQVGFVDAAALFPDASSAAIARALSTAGRDIGALRADIVFRLACEQAVACQLSSSVTGVASCTSDRRALWEQGKQRGYGEDCLDSALDVNACLATHGCSELAADSTPCDALADTNLALCAPYMLPDAGK